MQIANSNAAAAQAAVSEVLADEAAMINSLSETARSLWGTTSVTWSPLYDYNIVKGTANIASLNVISESLVQHMLPYNDPRLSVYATPAPQGPYKGQYFGQPKTTSTPEGFSFPGGNPHSTLGTLDYSQIGEYFTKPDAEFVLLSYEETCFLKARAALKGWGGSRTAEQYYVDGITASMRKYNIPQAQINAYLARPGVKWNTVVDTTGTDGAYSDYLAITTSAILKLNPLRQITMQQWLAGFYNAMDAWTLIRSTQQLEFPPHFNPDGGEGGTVGFAYIPQRLNYAPAEYQVNKEALEAALPWLGGADGLKTKLWFALPVVQNPNLPEWK